MSASSSGSCVWTRPRGASGGAGLGLPIARWIAEAHGGSLVLAPDLDDGVTFVATLPLRPPDGAA